MIFYLGLPMIWMGNLVFVFCFSLAWEGQEIGGERERSFEHFLRF